jgi:glycosyltransferase involved in cell wall biosynthesis
MAGYMIQAWSRRADCPTFKIIDSRGIGSARWSPFFLCKCLAHLVVKGRSYQLIHIHVAGRGSTFRKYFIVWLASLLGTRIVLHLHDYNYSAFCAGLPPVFQGAVKAMFGRADRIIVLGKNDHKMMLEQFGIDTRRVVIVANAVSAPAPTESRAQPKGDEVRILFLGCLSRRKGVHDLLNALAAKDVVDLPWRAMLAGGGKELPIFRQQAGELGLAAKVHFLDWLPSADVHGLLQSADILVLPSYDEGLAMSVLEGMSYGLAVVCTQVGALAEAVENEVSGLVVLPGDVAALAVALRRCICDPGIRLRLGAGAREAFAARYDVNKYPSKIARVYDEVVKEQSNVLMRQADG